MFSITNIPDHSVILTEDTDSFIIGERVWVGGTKPGQIAYIGETQFAPGEWAGIVLDDPIGEQYIIYYNRPVFMISIIIITLIFYILLNKIFNFR